MHNHFVRSVRISIDGDTGGSLSGVHKGQITTEAPHVEKLFWMRMYIHNESLVPLLVARNTL